ncbi:UvrD-helicase domain-containing protein [Gorillibacterium sp. sgz5001074]|uniref:UvrD-helicase domain-containing protein n=1 Tax=Gorillibacterium sp. sgz5001074 TaxID=3446695 RepID=UPI003F67389F
MNEEPRSYDAEAASAPAGGLLAGIPPKPEDSTWTDGQWRAIVREGTNLLVAAAAGSGKTAVLVQRIIRRISNESDPVDVDRLLVATFTKAAASEMRHRIGAALEDALFKRPDSDHLKKQLALLNKASITTLHSFCMEVIQRYFQMIDLDPGFRIADETEADIMRQEQLEALLEERYGESPDGHPFWRLTEWFGGDRSDAPLMGLLLRLYDASRSHPFPERWLNRQAELFEAAGLAGESAESEEAGGIPEQELLRNPWFMSLIRDVRLELEGAAALLLEGQRICGEPLGPAPYAANLEEDLTMVRELLEASGQGWRALHEAFQRLAFGKLKACKADSCDKELQEQVKELRKGAKDKLEKLREELFVRTPEEYFRELAETAPLLRELAVLTEDFAERYQAAKTDKGLVDFTDLEHYCLRILGEPDGEGGLRPTAAALAYREAFVEIMLDEYQDTNLVQETIVSLISRKTPGNRFIVGDVKQSIYRFRLAEPGLFLEKYRSYAGPGQQGKAEGERIDLARNFRSRRQVVDGVNFLFRQIMRETVGEMEYDADAELVCGARYPEAGDGEDPFLPELVLIDRDTPGGSRGDWTEDGGESGDDDASGAGFDAAEETEEPEAAQAEARYIGERIREMMGLDGGVPFLVAEKNGTQRPAQFRDFVILLRATRAMGPVLIEELGLLGIPAYADVSSGYFAATEVETVLSLLKIIDNPQQDIPLAAVLRSPIVGLNADELARVRLADRNGSFYDALQAWVREAGNRLQLQEQGLLHPVPGQEAGGGMTTGGVVLPFGQLELFPPGGEAWDEVAAASAPEVPEPLTPEEAVMADKLLQFERRLSVWRGEARQGSLSELIWSVYRETGYFDYAGGLPGGVQRQANLRALYDRARQYESTSFRGLFRFLRFVDRLREGGGDLGTARALGEQEDVVRIMSIHKSKGLEFPVVFVAGMGKMFNLMDLNGSFLIHKELGFGPKYTDTELRAVYPMLPQLAIRRRMRMETLAEEMRILYVALTRPKEKMILLGAVVSLENKLKKWARSLGSESAFLPDYMLAEAKSYLDWVVPAAMRHPGADFLRECAGDPVHMGRRLFAGETSAWSFRILSAMAFTGKAGVESVEGSAAPVDAPADGDALAEAVRRLVPLERAASGFADELDRRLSWSYPYAAASAMLTKTSVSELKRLDAAKVWRLSEDSAEWETPLHPALEHAAGEARRKQPDVLYRLPRFRSGRKLSPAEIGTLYHTVMQQVPAGEILDENRVEELLHRLEGSRILTAAEREAIDPAVIAAFFRTELGRRLAASRKVQRELPFSFGLRAGDVYPDCEASAAEETLLIQGVIDCLFEDPEGRLVLLDYKTDRVGALDDEALADRYRIQLELYARAIERIWKRRVDEKAVYYFDGARIIRY